MLLTVQDQRHFAFHHEQHTFGGGVGFRLVAAATRLHFHDVLREGLGKTAERTRQHPQTGTGPERQVAGNDIAHHALGNHRVGLGEDRAVGGQLRLRRVPAGWRVVAAGCGLLAHTDSWFCAG